MQNLKVWPHLILVGVVVAALAGSGVAYWMHHRDTALVASEFSAARIERVDGDVGVNQNVATNNQTSQQSNQQTQPANYNNGQWMTASANTPVSVGDQIYAGDNSHASIAFSGRNFARLDPNTSLDILALNESQTDVALRSGSAVFNVGELGSGNTFEVGTPCGAVDFQKPGLYQISFNDQNNAVVSVLSGQAQVADRGNSGLITMGESLTLVGQNANDAVVANLDPTRAGATVDDYYSYQYPKTYDHRYRDYSAYTSDPYYYDPYNRDVSYKYTSDWIPGIDDLDANGQWSDVADYGYCWHPNVASDWAPYGNGSWVTEPTFGLTWVSSEPWGYAPYHYGRWAYASDQWYWVPERSRQPVAYSPALVAFIPFDQSNSVGWVPLGPGDVYDQRYYGADWNARYISRQRGNDRFVNLNAPGAVTVVQVQNFRQQIDPRTIQRIDRQQIANVRPVLDPMSNSNIRQAAFQGRESRRRMDIPQDVARRIESTPVITSSTPVVPQFRRDVVRNLNVQTAPAQRGRALTVRDERTNTQQQGQAQQQSRAQNQPQPPQAQQQPQLTQGETRQFERRNQQITALSDRASRGDQRAQRQVLQLQQQQNKVVQQAAQRQEHRAQATPQSVQPQPQPRPVGEQAGQPIARPREQAQPQNAGNGGAKHGVPTPPRTRNFRQPNVAQPAPQRQPVIRQQQQPRASRQPAPQPRQQAAPRPQPVQRQAAPRPQPQQPKANPAPVKAQTRPAAQAQPRPQPARAPQPNPQPKGNGGNKDKKEHP